MPSIATDYTDSMNAIDIADDLQSNIHSDHFQHQGTARALTLSFLLATALTNSFILQKEGKPAWDPDRS
jgi:PleD family two-component response regulator